MLKYLGLLIYLKELQTSEKQCPVHCMGISPWGQSVTDVITNYKNLQKSKEVLSEHFPCLKKLKKNIQEEMVPKQNCTHIKHISLGFESTNS